MPPRGKSGGGRALRTRALALVVLLLVSAMVVVASPAFATPNLTASSGTRTVAPFITPVGDSARSNIIATSTDSRFVFPAGIVIRCRTATFGGFVGSTHTQVAITSFTYGNGAPGACDAGGFGANTSIDGGATTTAPWFLHIRSFQAGNGSASGTINVTRAFPAFTLFAGACQVTIAAQSLDVTYTNATRLFVVSDPSVAYTGPVPCGSGNARFDATYTLRMATGRDAPRVTSAS